MEKDMYKTQKLAETMEKPAAVNDGKTDRRAVKADDKKEYAI
ncbi:MAG: hypothetical protein ACI4AB_13865 [Acetatifactor sp.]